MYIKPQNLGDVICEWPLGQFQQVPPLRPRPRRPRLGLVLAAVQREEGRQVLAGLVQVDARVVDVGHVVLDFKLG